MKKADHATDRQLVHDFQQIVNVGPATALDFQTLGLQSPQQLVGRDPWKLYHDLSVATKTLQDPCVLDVLWAAVDYMNGNPPQPWWHYTAARKVHYQEQLREFAEQIRSRSHP